MRTLFYAKSPLLIKISVRGGLKRVSVTEKDAMSAGIGARLSRGRSPQFVKKRLGLKIATTKTLVQSCGVLQITRC